MTMPDERTRSLLWAGGFLIELARDRRLPVDVRRSAVIIARHFPTVGDIASMAMFRHPSGLGVGLVPPQEAGPWREGCKFGPLTYSTRLEFPEELRTRARVRRHGKPPND
ncbi:MAG TPA: BPSL0761 family protein [Rhodanobacteraceae bacterium]